MNDAITLKTHIFNISSTSKHTHEKREKYIIHTGLKQTHEHDFTNIHWEQHAATMEEFYFYKKYNVTNIAGQA